MPNLRIPARVAALMLPLLASQISVAQISVAQVSADTSLDAATRTAIQSVIAKQLDAFGHADAKGAEAFAAPAIQDRFPEPSEFFAMVRENYAALINPKSTSFGETTPSPHGPLQKVTIVAADGTVWTAIYALEQVNGEWRIDACGLEKDENQRDI